MLNYQLSVKQSLAAVATLALACSASATLPDPDGQPADMTKPVQVYLMMGQSNILGQFGRVSGTENGRLENAVDNKGLYPYLKDDNGDWTQRNDVRYVRVQGSGGPSGGAGTGSVINNQWLNIDAVAGGNGGADDRIGIEHAVGHHLGNAIDAPVMVLTSAIGNRALGWDLLPPGSPQYDHTNGRTYAGYGDSPESWETGTTPTRIGWQAGLQYDGDVARAKAVLADIGSYYPGATEVEVAGFFWWQGDRDRRTEAHAVQYEENLVRLIGALRDEFDAPDASFVLATLGQTIDGTPTGSFGANEQLMIEGMLNVDGDSGLYPEFEGNVATVYTNPLLGPLGGDSGGHYNGDAETYMNVGEAMGAEMVALIPEPTSLALLGLGGLMCMRRRR